jgi:hypothetical protein
MAGLAAESGRLHDLEKGLIGFEAIRVADTAALEALIVL